MSMNTTPSGERTHIAFFGRRNAGKSSIVNAVTGQALAVVSPRKGTTTDPVWKAMELLPLGPVMIIDTPGYDDKGQLGELRVQKTQEILGRTDLAVLVIDGTAGMAEDDRELIREFRERKIPYIIAYNKLDLVETAGGNAEAAAPTPCVREKTENSLSPEAGSTAKETGADSLWVSAATGAGIPALKEKMAAAAAANHLGTERPLAADLIPPGGTAVLVVPIDESAPKGRLILPQQQVIRDLIGAGDSVMVCRESELAQTLGRLAEAPDLVITDSQVFGLVAEILPEDVPLTSFSILMARHKGFLDTALAGVRAIDELKEGDRILIAEGCTHHRQCNDIGTVKIPRWLQKHSQVGFVLETCSGREFPQDLSEYRVVIHCGGCMLNEREVQTRMQRAVSQGVPFINYGVLIAYMNGILERSIAPIK